MLHLSCLCTRITIEVAEKPAFINECNCTLCSKSGAQWAYFHPSAISIQGHTQLFSRTDKAAPNARLHFCPNCGSTTHFTLTDTAVAKFGNTLNGINMRLADETDLAGIELRYPDGRSWPGEGAFTQVRSPRIIGA